MFFLKRKDALSFEPAKNVTVVYAKVYTWEIFKKCCWNYIKTLVLTLWIYFNIFKNIILEECLFFHLTVKLLWFLRKIESFRRLDQLSWLMMLILIRIPKIIERYKIHSSFNYIELWSLRLPPLCAYCPWVLRLFLTISHSWTKWFNIQHLFSTHLCKTSTKNYWW